MKRTMKLLLVLVLAALMTGCVKYDVSMEIGKDKSVSIVIIDAIESSYSSYGSTDEEAEVLKEKGFSVEDYDEDGYVGYKLSKKYGNIDDISSTEEVTVELADLVDEDKEEIKVYFQKKKSLFKTTYIANFTFDASDSDSSASSYTSSMELNYRVKLPVKATSQNATEVSEDGKELSWDLKYGSINEIKYEFSMVNKSMYFIFGGIIAIVIILIVVVVLNNKKKNPKQYQMVGGMPMPENNLSGQGPMNNTNFNPIGQDSNPVNPVVNDQPMAEPNVVENNVVNPDSNNFPSMENQPPIIDGNDNSQPVPNANENMQ